MHLQIIVNDKDDETLALLRETFQHLKRHGRLEVEKHPDGSQEWSVSCAGATRRFLVSFNYSITKVDTRDTVVNTREEGEPQKNAAPGTGKAAIVNDKNTSFIPRHAAAREKKKGAAQPTLFEPVTVRREEVQEFIDYWNSCIWMPKMIGTDRQSKVIHSALTRQAFKDNYVAAIKEVAKSKFLRGGLGKGFKLTIDWFCEPDNFDKMVEGVYRDNTPPETAKEFTTESI